MRKVLFLLVLLVFALVACSESTVEKVEKEEPAGKETATETGQPTEEVSEPTEEEVAQEETTAPEVFTLGDTVNFDGIHITFNSVKVETETFGMAAENGKYVVLDITVENTNSDAYALSSILQMTLADADGYTYDIALYDGKGSLDGEVGSGRKMRGEVAFDVPDSDYYEYIFEDPFTSGQAIWSFEVE